VIRRLSLIGSALLLAACATPRSHAPGSQPRLSGDRIAAAATAVIGQPYRYGGTAPGGFDCSGLVAYAAGMAGVPVPRTAAEQLLAGVPVERRQLRPGDLVFLHLSRRELHVGVAIDNGRFVHAPSHGGRVRIDSLDAAPYARSFIGARRLVK